MTAVPRICLVCGFGLPEGVEICSHHVSVERGDWADGNRAWCNFFHRRVVRAPARGESLAGLAWEPRAYNWEEEIQRALQRAVQLAQAAQSAQPRGR